MSFLIMIGAHSWGQLFPPSVRSGGSRGRHLLASWGSWRYPVSRGSQGSRRSQWSLGSQGSTASPAALESRAVCVYWEPRWFWQSGGSWGCGGSWASWVSILGVWLIFIFCLRKTQKQKNRTACRHTFFLWPTLQIAIYPEGMYI